MIKVSILDKHPIMCDALKALLVDVDDIKIVSTSNTVSDFLRVIPNTKITKIRVEKRNGVSREATDVMLHNI